jgi:hypothetical protein
VREKDERDKKAEERATTNARKAQRLKDKEARNAHKAVQSHDCFAGMTDASD